MIYLTKTKEGKEQHNITTFFANEKKWKTYLILVIVLPGDEMLVANQIHRQHLDEVNWLIITVEDYKKIFVPGFREKEFLNLLVMELTMTGDKKDVFLGAHNWEMLNIEHEPRTDPFDEVFAKVINRMIDQSLYNYGWETLPFQKKLNQLFYDFMTSGMFHMQSDPEKAMGN